MRLIYLLLFTALISCGGKSGGGKNKKKTTTQPLTVESILELNEKSALEVAIKVEEYREQVNAPKEEFYQELDDIFFINCQKTCSIERRI